MNEWVFHVDPPKPGHYLVYQRTEDNRKYRFTRFWNGCDWNNPNEEKYGNVVAWAELLQYPD